VRQAIDDRSGAAAIMMALSLPVMLGVAGLAVDAALWQYNRNNAQGAADAAAMSAVASAIAGDSIDRVQSEAYSAAAAAGYIRGQNATVTLNNPPTSGNYAGNSNAYEVIITEAQPQYFSALYMKGGPTISARAVALVTSTSIASCVVSLASSGSGVISLSGNGSVDLTNCNLDANSPSKTSLTLNGNALVAAQGVHLAGGFSTTGNASIVTPNLTTFASPVNDPYAGRTIPSYSGCNETNYTPTGGTLPNFGAVTVYCGGLSFSSNTTVTVPAGIYIIDGGNFSISGGASVTGTGVTFILTSHTGTGIGSFNVSGTGVVTLTAPTTGPTAGIVFWVDKRASSSTTSSYTGNGTGNLTGAIYAPSSAIDYSGNGSSDNGCTQIVSNTSTFVGNATLSHNCAGTGVNDPGTTSESGKPVE
jgi:Flp pilus assembly protein TadG